MVAVAESLVPASVDLWKRVQAKMLPTPAKFHYQFNMRDLSKASPFGHILSSHFQALELPSKMMTRVIFTPVYTDEEVSSDVLC